MREMKQLLRIKHTMPTMEEGVNIRVGFTTRGNEHLYSDKFGRSKVLRKEDLKELDRLLRVATPIADHPVEHNYNIKHFYYYRVELHGKPI